MITAIVLQKCSVFVTDGKANTEQYSSKGNNTRNKKLRKYVILNSFHRDDIKISKIPDLNVNF